MLVSLSVFTAVVVQVKSNVIIYSLSFERFTLFRAAF